MPSCARWLTPVLFALSLCMPLASCSSTPATGKPPAADSGAEAGPCSTCGASSIQHLVLIVQENHTFDNHFGRYCTATTGSNPTCTSGPACCEAAPATDPVGIVPVTLDDYELGSYDPDHTSTCETVEMDGGKMDMYATAPSCGSPHNVAYSDPQIMKPYWALAGEGALADRYFQPLIGQSSSNDMYFARADFVFSDNAVEPEAIGGRCGIFSATPEGQYTDTTIADLLIAANVSFGVYAGGYETMGEAVAKNTCPFPAPADCPLMIASYPCLFDPSDIPFEYYPSTRDNPKTMHDLSQLAVDLAAGTLPAVSYVKGIGYKTEHPGSLDTLTAGVEFVTETVSAVLASPLASSTLVLVTYDEGGGYFDHVTPPPANVADGKPYGTRVPMLALGPFAQVNHVSHVVMEHSSVVKFIEWNWLGQQTGQLGTRDAVVNNIGSLLDSDLTGVAVPD